MHAHARARTDRLLATRGAAVPETGSLGDSADDRCDDAATGRSHLHERFKGLRRLLLASRKELEQLRTDSFKELASAVKGMWDREAAFVRRVGEERDKLGDSPKK